MSMEHEFAGINKTGVLNEHSFKYIIKINKGLPRLMIPKGEGS